MEKPVKGDVIVVPFPYSDLSAAKNRPAFVAAVLDGDDVILCQITSVHRADKYAVSLSQQDFIKGRLPVESVIRPNRLFTAESSILLHKAGSLRQDKVIEVQQQLVSIFLS